MDVKSAFSVRRYTGLSDDTTAAAWAMYLKSFAPLRTMAIQKHVMSLADFSGIATDRRVTKYVATGADGQILGMSTLTNDLEAWPLIEAAWFEHHHPLHYQFRQIWYLGFACVANPNTDGRVFAALIEEMSLPARSARGMVFMDFATANRLRLLSGIRRTVRRLDPDHTFRAYDQQEFWGFDFSQPGIPEVTG